MRVFGLWNGGRGSYSPGELETDCESWRSLTDAKRSLRHRYDSGSWLRDDLGRAVNFDEDGLATLGHPTSDLRPAVGEDTHIDLYPATREGKGWRIGSEPYARLTLGPRRGVQVESF